MFWCKNNHIILWVLSLSGIKEIVITKTHLFKYIENFTTKNWKFSDKNSDIFHISAQNKACWHLLEWPHWGSSNEYPQSMFLNRNTKNNVYHSKPQFYNIKLGFKGNQNYIPVGMFSWCKIKNAIRWSVIAITDSMVVIYDQHGILVVTMLCSTFIPFILQGFLSEEGITLFFLIIYREIPGNAVCFV